MFKSKYFPNGTIFDAKKSSGFYAWKSTIKERGKISMGAKWRVGDGRDIWVFKDFWLPGNSGGQVTSPPLVLDVDTCVANLIGDSVEWWNTRIIDEHFSPFEAQSIKSIPLCISPQPNYLHWPFERNGKLLCEIGF